jgi:4-aminobutyrate aminotransferase-like enzyme
MRGTIHNAMVAARDVLDGVMKQVKAENVLTDDEAVARYVNQHRGRPEAMAAFVLERAPAGGNPIEEMRKYEADMERRARAKGVK